MVNREKRIQEIAYHLWVRDGRPHGQSDQHWHEAVALFEAEVVEPKSAAAERAAEPTRTGAGKPKAAAKPVNAAKPKAADEKAAPAVKPSSATPKAAAKPSAAKAPPVVDKSPQPAAEKPVGSSKRKPTTK